ncbi:MobV family relaxase, partial [Lacticaseibacillus paracasei]
WVVGSDHQFFESLTNAQTKSFFEDAYAWFANRYGAENIPYATVHMDETTPHMHMGVIPLTNGRLSAKSLFNREELRSVQAEFPEYLKSRFWKIERGQKGSQHRHLSVEEYKKIAPELQNKREQLKKDLQGYQLIDVSKLEPETIPQQVKTGLFKTETQYVQTENYILTPKDYERLSQRVRGVSDVRVAQESIWEIKQRLDAKEAHLEEREKSLDHREERIEDSENVLAEYNQLYRTAEEKTTKVEQLTKENKQL